MDLIQTVSMPSCESSIDTWSNHVVNAICSYLGSCTEEEPTRNAIESVLSSRKFTGLDISLGVTVNGKNWGSFYARIYEILRPHLDTMSWIDTESDRSILGRILTELILSHMDRVESHVSDPPISNPIPSPVKTMPISRFIVLPAMEAESRMIYILEGQFAYACSRRRKLRFGFQSMYRISFQLDATIVGFRWDTKLHLISAATGSRFFSIHEYQD